MLGYVDTLYLRALECRDLALSSDSRASEDYRKAAQLFEESAELHRKGEYKESSRTLDDCFVSLRYARLSQQVAENGRDADKLARLVDKVTYDVSGLKRDADDYFSRSRNRIAS